MLFPNEKYVTVLLLRGHDNAVIQQKTRALGFGQMTVEEIDSRRQELFSTLPSKLVKSIFPPKKFDFSSFTKTYAAALAPLDIDEVLPVLSGKRSLVWEEALSMVLDNSVRTTLQALTIYGVEREKLKILLERRHGFKPTEEGLSCFLKYFWDIGKMTRVEMFNYIHQLPVGVTLKKTLLDAFHKRENAIKWRFAGENVLTLEKVLQEVMNEAFLKFQNSVSQEDPDSVMKITKWADLAIKAAEKYDKISKQTGEDLFTSLKFDLEKLSQDGIALPDDVDGEVV